MQTFTPVLTFADPPDHHPFSLYMHIRLFNYPGIHSINIAWLVQSKYFTYTVFKYRIFKITICWGNIKFISDHKGILVTQIIPNLAWTWCLSEGTFTKSLAHFFRLSDNCSWNGVSMVVMVRKCFSRRLMRGIGNLLYTMFFSATTISLKSLCTRHFTRCVPSPKSTYLSPPKYT